MKKFFVSIGVMAVVLFATYRAYQLYEQHKVVQVQLKEKLPVRVAKASYRQMTWQLDLIGDIKPKQEVDVYPKIAGEILKRLYVKEGDQVKVGQVIGEIDKETIIVRLLQVKAALASAKANLARIEAELTSLKEDYERTKRLYAQKVVSKQKLEHITSQYTATLAARKLAIAQVNEAEATLKEMQILYNHHTIKAPISGIITAKYVDEGSMTSTKTPIVRITDDSLVKVVVAINEKELPYIKINQTAYIRLDAYPEKEFKGQVKVINPRLDPATRTASIEIYVHNPQSLLKVGMFAHVRLVLGKKKVLAIPRDALEKLPGTGSYYVFIIEEGKARIRNVKIGMSEDNLVEIKKGLKEGDLVVTQGQNRLKDGMDLLLL